MFIPYKVDVPMQRWPIGNWVLMGLTIVISLAMFMPLSDWAEQRSPLHDMSPEVQQALRAAGLHVAPPEPSIVDYFLLEPGNFRITQLVGNLFIHAGFLHLAGNMLFLFVFGNAVNAKLGQVKFLALYLGAGILESCVWIVLGPRVPCLGASGAIMGVVGAFLILYPLNDVSIGYMFTLFYRGVFQLSAMWVIALYFAFDLWGLVSGGNSGVAYLAHVVGFLSGAAATAGLLWFKLVEMDPQERSLLQVWKMMPHVEDSQPARRLAGTMPDYLLRQQAKNPPAQTSQASIRQAPRQARKRDDGPIPLD